MKIKSIYLTLAAFGLSFILALPAYATCYVHDQSGRLANYCAIDKINGARVDLRSIQFIDRKLKMEGNRFGLGLPVNISKHHVARSVFPVVSYSDNINGGNSTAPLELGNLTFTGDPELYKKSGVVVGLGAGIGGRLIYAEGSYLSYGLQARYSHSPEYNIGIGALNAHVCNVSHIKNWWYVDSCVRSARVHKDITDDTTHTVNLGVAKVFKSSVQSYSEAKLGVNRVFTDDYAQNQISFGIETIHANKIGSSVSVSLGEPLQNQLASKYSISVGLSAYVAQRPLTVRASYGVSDGGKLLGVDRSDATYAASVSYPVWKKLKASLGYRMTNSTIDYFDVSTPTFSLELPAIRF